MVPITPSCPSNILDILSPPIVQNILFSVIGVQKRVPFPPEQNIKSNKWTEKIDFSKVKKLWDKATLYDRLSL